MGSVLDSDWVDLYDVLGLKITNGGLPTKEDANRAYRRLALQYHPDRLRRKLGREPTGDEVAHAQKMFELISQANEHLQDDQKRLEFEAQYKRKLEHIVHLREMDENTRKMESELIEREKRAKESKRTEESKLAEYRRVQEILEQDRLYKEKLMAQLGIDLNDMDDDDDDDEDIDGEQTQAEKPEVEFFRNVFLTRENEILNHVTQQQQQQQ